MDSRKINAESQAKHEREHLRQPPPKEPRYRRKPLEWTHHPKNTRDVADWEWYEARTPIYEMQRVYIDRVGSEWKPNFGSNVAVQGMYRLANQEEPCTLEEAKARVEAEITRRLESVLEVCE